MHYGPLRIDLTAREVAVDDVPLHLTTKEFDLLACMAAHPRQVFSRDDLLREVWHSAGDWQRESTVTEHIRRLRAKIEVDPLNPSHPAHRPRRRLPLRPAGRGRARHDGDQSRGPVRCAAG